MKVKTKKFNLLSTYDVKGHLTQAHHVDTHHAVSLFPLKFVNTILLFYGS